MIDKIKQRFTINTSYAILGYFLLSLLILLYLIYISPNKFISDERDFVPNIKVLAQYGFSLDFLRNIRGQSPGPLYQYIYYPIGRIVALTPKSMRLINFCFLLGNLYLLKLLTNFEVGKNAFVVSLLILAIPMTWNISGMAFTELPALFFCMLSLFLLKTAIGSFGNNALFLAITAGLCAGTSIIGRSPFLMVVPASVILYVLPGKKSCVTLFLISAAIFPSIVFYAWRGLVPPDVQNIQSGYSIAYLLLCVTYFFLMTLIIYPQMFSVKRIHYVITFIVIAVSLLLNILFFKISYTPMNGILTSNRIPSVIKGIYPYIFQSITLGCTYFFIISVYKYVVNNKPGVWRCFLLAASILIVLTTIKSAAHFTSKYVLQAYPFFLIFLASSIKLDKSLLVRAIIGSVIGMATLYTYYSIHTMLHY